jgi:hypothetical protein
LRITAETVALMQHRHVTIGEPGALIEMTAGEATQTIEMRLDVTK